MIYQEDLNAITLETVENLIHELSLYAVQLTEIQEDQLYSAILNKLEIFSDYPEYRNYN